MSELIRSKLFEITKENSMMIQNVWSTEQKEMNKTYKRRKLENRDLTIASDQENIEDLLKKLADNSTDIICVSTFLIEESTFTESLLEASERGVRVYLLTAREEELKQSDEEFEDNSNKAKIIENHKKLLEKFAGKILVRTSPSFHAKFALFDPKNPKKKGIISTANFTKDAMKGSKNFELSADLKPDEIDSHFEQFKYGFWKEAKHEMIQKEKGGELSLQPTKPSPNVPLNESKINHPHTRTNSKSLKENINKMIQSAQNELILSAWAFDMGNEVTEEIKKSLKKEIHVKIITRDNEKIMESILDLAKNSAEIITLPKRPHAKFIIADGKQSIIMTANFSNKGLEEGFETGIILNEKETVDFQTVIEELIKDKKASFKTEINVNELNQGHHLRYNNEKKQNEEITIENEYVIKENIKKTVNLSDFQNYMVNEENKKELEKATPKDKMFKKIIGKLEIFPEQFKNENAAYLEEKDGITKIREKGKELFLISTQKEYEKAKSLGDEEVLFATPDTIKKIKENTEKKESKSEKK
jgi:Phosphatidylserine/phosphatidylglycerophosphate/cardiolipin synthases and related enzymes